jgi:hypothetical protein
MFDEKWITFPSFTMIKMASPSRILIFSVLAGARLQSHQAERNQTAKQPRALPMIAIPVHRNHRELKMTPADRGNAPASTRIEPTMMVRLLQKNEPFVGRDM